MQKVTEQDGQSANIVDENIEQMKALFPDAFTEGGVDFDVLRQLLGDSSVLDEGEEKYGLNWHGKKQARQIALTPSGGTLLPCPEESVNWDTTQNLFIEGDNLEVLKLLHKSYAGEVKLIYIDPPYNTDGDFVYPDRFKEGLDTYLEYTGQRSGGSWAISESGRERSGRKHSLWLSMMLTRLKAARNLLSKDGVVALHIDENEITNAANLMNECFGEENNLGVIIWDKRNPKGDATKIAIQHEYLLVYVRDMAAFKDSKELKRPKANAEKMLRKAERLFRKIGRRVAPDDLKNLVDQYDLDVDLSEHEKDYSLADVNKEFRAWLTRQDVSGGEAAYKHIDENGEVFRTVSMAWPNKKQAPDDYYLPLIHPKTKKQCPVPERGWRNPPSTMQDLLNSGMIIFGEDETKQPERKYLLRENMLENVPSVFPFGGSDDALLSKLKIPFDNPKPVNFAASIISYFAGKDGLVMDFFAGSATVGHACYQLNSEKGHHNRFILVQLPEKIDEKNAGQKAAFRFCKSNKLKPNIAELGKERLRRAANFLGEEEIDSGFRVFKLAGSNINSWNPDRTDLEDTLLSHKDHLIEGRSEQDVLYELLLKRGIELTVPIEEKKVAGKTIYSIGYGVLFACLDTSIAKGDVDAVAGAIAEWHKELEPETDSHVFFRDSAFADDIAKTNMAAILEQNGIAHVRSL